MQARLSQTTFASPLSAVVDEVMEDLDTLSAAAASAATWRPRVQCLQQRPTLIRGAGELRAPRHGWSCDMDDDVTIRADELALEPPTQIDASSYEPDEMKRNMEEMEDAGSDGSDGSNLSDDSLDQARHDSRLEHSPIHLHPIQPAMHLAALCPDARPAHTKHDPPV